MALGSEIRAARLRAGLTQNELADRSGTSQATLSAYENGRKVPSARTLERILAAAGAQLKVVPRQRPVVQPSPEEYRRRGQELARVIEFAATLPTRHEPELRYPILRDIVKSTR